MKSLFCKFIISVCLLLPTNAFATGVPVVDVAAIANLLIQIKQFQEQIQLLTQQKNFMSLNIESLAKGGMLEFIKDFRSQFSDIMGQIEGYRGLMQQIERLDEIYPRFDEVVPDDVKQVLHILQKESLITRIQMKHALKVGSTILDTIPQSQDQIEQTLQSSRGAVGVLQAAQAGNQLLGSLGTSMNRMSVQLGTFVQSYAAKSLEENQQSLLKHKRTEELLEGFADHSSSIVIP